MLAQACFEQQQHTALSRAVGRLLAVGLSGCTVVLPAQNTSLVACQGRDPSAADVLAAWRAGAAGGADLVSQAACQLPPALAVPASHSAAGGGSTGVYGRGGAGQLDATYDPLLLCPFAEFAATGGDVSADPSFLLFAGCSCTHEADRLQLTAPSSAAASSSNSAASPLGGLQLHCIDGSASAASAWRRVTTLVGVVPAGVLLLAMLFMR